MGEAKRPKKTPTGALLPSINTNLPPAGSWGIAKHQKSGKGTALGSTDLEDKFFPTSFSGRLDELDPEGRTASWTTPADEPFEVEPETRTPGRTTLTAHAFRMT